MRKHASALMLTVGVCCGVGAVTTTVRGQACEVVEKQAVFTAAPAMLEPFSSIAILGNDAILGIPGTGNVAGKAFAYHRSDEDSPWGDPVVLTPDVSAVGDFFGTSVAMSGNIAIIGAKGTLSLPGAAYIFRKIDGAWVQQQKLQPTVAGSSFGTAVDIEGDVAAVGQLTSPNGRIVVFRHDGESWNLEANLVPTDGSFFMFGRSVSISGPRILGGASNRAIVFEYNGAAWNEHPPLIASGGEVGKAVALNGDVAVVGAPSLSGPGKAFVFTHQGGIWTLVQELTSDNPGTSDKFGASLALGDALLIGSPSHDPQTVGDGSDGAVHVYEFDGQTWVLQHKLVGSSSGNSQFGHSLALNQEDVLVAVRQETWSGFQLVALAYPLHPADCNNNGVPDRCDEPDCDGNTVIDSCELDGNGVSDCDGDGVPDVCEPAAAYVIDDGTHEAVVGGSSSGPNDLIWMNRFDVFPASQFVTHIDIAFTSSATPGHPITVLIYDDPNNDGFPTDAVLLAAVETQTHAPGMQAKFSRVAVPRTYVGEVGDRFFIGAFSAMDLSFYSYAPATADGGSPSSLRSWIFNAPLGQINLSAPGSSALPSFYSTYDFMIRGVSDDCNGNGTVDACDIANGLSADENGNGIPDECEGQCAGDVVPNVGKGGSSVDVDDLTFIINNWGPCLGGECMADIAPPGGNGIVNVDDLLMVINNWGPCD